MNKKLYALCSVVVIAAILFACFAPVGSAAVDKGATDFGSNAYKVYYYDSISRDRASTQCSNKGESGKPCHLAIIDESGEQNFIAGLVGDGNFWIGNTSDGGYAYVNSSGVHYAASGAAALDGYIAEWENGSTTTKPVETEPPTQPAQPSTDQTQPLPPSTQSTQQPVVPPTQPQGNPQTNPTAPSVTVQTAPNHIVTKPNSVIVQTTRRYTTAQVTVPNYVTLPQESTQPGQTASGSGNSISDNLKLIDQLYSYESTYYYQEVAEENGSTSIIIQYYIGSSSEAEIPSQINNMPVKYIGYQAFQSKTMQAVVIPDSVIEIDETAFTNRYEDFTIYGVTGSAAENFASKFDDINFVAVTLVTEDDNVGTTSQQETEGTTGSKFDPGKYSSQPGSYSDRSFWVIIASILGIAVVGGVLVFFLVRRRRMMEEFVGILEEQSKAEEEEDEEEEDDFTIDIENYELAGNEPDEEVKSIPEPDDGTGYEDQITFDTGIPMNDGDDIFPKD